MRVPDEDATELPVQERQIGFVFQSYALFRHMTIAQNIGFGPRIRRLGIDVDQRCDSKPCNKRRSKLGTQHTFVAGLPLCNHAVST